MFATNQQIEQIYKAQYGQFIGLLLKRFPDLSIEIAEDVVQDSFAKAAIIWPQKGLPHNPSGWLYQTSKNRAINLLRKLSPQKCLNDSKTVSLDFESLDRDIDKDLQLSMLIACCHPDLAPKTQVTIALKYVINLKVQQISQQLGLSLETVEKILYRARQKIKAQKIEFSIDEISSYKNRLNSIHKVIYLIFNTGFKEFGREGKKSKDLCEEALILNTYLIKSPLWNAATKALQSLLLFNIARFDTRFDEEGNSIELEYQNRNLWNSQMIYLGHKYLLESEDKIFSSYHLEAAILYQHCIAKKFIDTNWGAICKYYEVLIQTFPNPFAELNYAVALQYNQQDDKAYDILIKLKGNPYLKKSAIMEKTVIKYFNRTKRNIID